MNSTTSVSVKKLQGSVYFHLAEQKHNADYPFAFLATYAEQMENNTQSPHIPLGRALQKDTLEEKRALLLTVLDPLSKAAEKSLFLAQCIASGEIFQPTALTASRAYKLLQDIPLFEEAGIAVRVPNWWQPKKTNKPTVTVKIGTQAEGLAGLNSLLDFDISVSLPDGSTLSQEELDELYTNKNSFVQVRGQWIELDNVKLNEVLLYWKKKNRNGLTLTECLRLLSGMPDAANTQEMQKAVATWSTVIEGKQLHEMLNAMRNPELSSEKAIKSILADTLQAQLRPYQFQGVQWLWTLYMLKLGGCLADDMGLGKTIQVLALLLLIQKKFPNKKHLLIMPASLLGNWSAEIRRFAPGLRTLILHSSAQSFDTAITPDLSSTDLVITTYGMASRLEFLYTSAWDMVILDEAQAIKNPNTKQTKAVKKLNGQIKFTLTGTPIENNLLDLWSLFDFFASGLLGSSKNFASHMNNGDSEKQKSINASLQRLASPYILRRLKSDKRIINDLPDKTEMTAYCTLTKQQALLYQKTVDDLAFMLQKDIDGIERKGIVLSYLMRLKQICNHPNQLLGHNQYDPDSSGKFIRLQELCSLIAQKKEKVLIFTQFREIIPSLSACLKTLFDKPGLELHGQTAIKKRAELVAEFQKEDGPPFFVLSLKAGGTGLNLTHASHIIHFDRWWNPAVEDQATDRAYRIGQKKNVLVHKFVCRGTIEEKIDTIIFQKRSLAQSVIGSEQEVTLSELSNAELLNIITLDIDRALGENNSTEKERF